jgi:tRNA threonylcarbamoyladenosine biosynthesis protein TsaE
MEYITKSALETQEIGQKFGDHLKGGETVALIGELGSGKTTFVQGLAQALKIDKRIISPTFIILRHYLARSTGLSRSVEMNFYHLDLYRLDYNLAREIENLGLADIWDQKDNIVVIEWAEKIKALLPPKTITVKFDILNQNKRKITIND